MTKAPSLATWLQIAVLLLIGGSYFTVSARQGRQSDLAVYYWAADAHSQGGNPYMTGSLIEASGGAIAQDSPGFIYAPLYLYLFNGMLLFDFSTVFYGTLAAKLIILGALLYLWCCRFLKEHCNIWFLFFVLIAFNLSTAMDVVSGNVQMVELLTLWLGFLCFVERRYATFGLLVTLAATVKFTPIFFLSLLLIERTRSRLMVFLACSALFTSYLALNCLIEPELTRHFLARVSAMQEFQRHNPTLFAFSQDMGRFIADGVSVAYEPAASYAFYVCACIVICALSYRAAVADEAKSADGQKYIVYLACLTYTILAPRMKGYTYMNNMAPAFFAIAIAPRISSSVLLFVAAMLPVHNYTANRVFTPLVLLLFEYYELWLIATLWVVLIRIGPFPDKTRISHTENAGA